MDRIGWKKSCRQSANGRRRWLLLVLTLAGCQTDAPAIKENTVLAMAATVQTWKTQAATVRGQMPDPEEIGLPISATLQEQKLDLNGALRLAGLENPKIGLADEMVRANQAELMLARSLILPTLNVGTTLSLHQGALQSSQGIIRTVDRDSLYFGAGADVRGAGTVAIPGIILTAHLGDAIFAPRVARQKVVSSSFDAQATRNNVLLQVAHAYLALAGAEAQVLALRQSQSELTEVANLTHNFAEKGQGREGDAQRALGEKLLLQGTLEKAKEDVATAGAELARLLSLDPAIRIRPEAGALPVLQLVDMNIPLEVLLQEALAKRPEIAARSAEVAMYQTRLRQERVRPLVPTLAVGFSAGDFGGGSDLVGYRFSHFDNRTDFDVVAFWTLQNLGFGNLAQQKRVRAEIGQAEALRAGAIDQVRREVAEALVNAQAQHRQLGLARTQVATAHKAFREDLERAKNLQGLLIEVLDSLRLLTNAREKLVASMVGYSQVQFDLWVALGNMPVVTRR